MNMSTPTPLVPLPSVGEAIYAKLEHLHPSGTIKHRAIVPWLEDLQERGELPSGRTIAIRSAGSAAVTAAWVGARLGYAVEAVLPPVASPHIVAKLRWLGARVHVLPIEQGTAKMRMLADDPEVFVLAQANEARLLPHYGVVADELLVQLEGVAAITVGLGTGLSAMGIARGFERHGSPKAIWGVEPAEAAVASGRPWAPHGIPGLAPPVAQPLLDKSALEGIDALPSALAWDCARSVAHQEGWLLGPSSGATIAAARRLRQRGESGPIVAICACGLDDYLALHTP